MCAKDLYEQIRQYVNRYWKVWLVAFIAMLAAFGYMLTNPVLTIDEETWILQSENSKLWLLQGRPGIYLQNLIYTDHGRFVPFFAELMSLFLWSAAGFLFAGIFFAQDLSEKKRENVFRIFIFCAYFNTLPFVVGESMAFSMMTVQEYVGLLLTVLAVLLTLANTEKLRLPFLGAALVSLTFAISCYQALIGIYITAVAALCLLFYEQRKKWGRFVFSGIILCALSMGILFALNKGIGRVIGTAGYLTDNYVGWSEGIGHALFMALANVIRILFAVPVRTTYIYGGGVIRIITVAFIADTVFRMTREKGFARRSMVLLLSAAVAISPLFLYIVLGTYHTSGRMLLALSLSGAFELALILRDIRPGFWCKAAQVAALVLILINISNMNRIYYYDSIVYNYDVKTADMVMYDIEKSGADYHSKPVAFVGMRQMDPLPVEELSILGGSFFSWDDGNEKRMVDFIRTRGYELIQPTAEQMTEAAAYSEQMDCWPEESGILETDTMIIVKFSEPTEIWYQTNNATR